ncbi:uncharacterized protein LOC126195393 [Schistocerca nitens]|uniref:uncharacterized protein LOC126195393 n=1 Tax=Schistocerca nitens TaxID=7011 RepID=UPI0021177CA2|nr:uncharacterized protein LOC126195393 [Schistocerca nitens]
MPANFRDEEPDNPASDATQPDMMTKAALVHEEDRLYPPCSSASCSDAGSSTSVVFGHELTGTSLTPAASSEAKSRNSATSRDEEKGFPATHAAESDTEDKMTIAFDDDASSTTTSEDSEADNYCYGGTSRKPQSDRPPPYIDLLQESKPKPPPAFEADPVRYILGMKLPIADSGFCACNHLSSAYSTVFFIICYASFLIADACHEITPIVRCLYAYKFQLFLSKEQQYVLHGWTGVLLIISAFFLWLGIFLRSRSMLMVWLLVMLVYVVMGLVVWLLGMLLSFAADGWNTHSTIAVSAGFLDIGLEFYLLHMVYSYNRYMHDEAPKVQYYDPQLAAAREVELARLGYREVHILGIPITAPITPTEEPSWRPGSQVMII